MKLPAIYSLAAIQKKWNAYWQAQRLFKPDPTSKKPAYSMVMPPPNITGRLHMGHVLNLTIQDVLVRKAHMEGYDVCWVAGLDHASIATEAKVLAYLEEQGLSKKNLDRATFLTHAWAWKKKYGEAILAQMKELGIACDWDHPSFTLDPLPTATVTKAFVQLYTKGYIYRGKRMINWDPKGQTALADEEVVYKEVAGTLYYIAYPLVEEEGHITIATTRPETLLADVAVAVHPADLRYQHLIGKAVYVPLVQRKVPIIADSYVTPQFGTGCLKVTPAHDSNDYELAQRHQLPLIDIFLPDGSLSKAGGAYAGLDREIAREKIVAALQQQNLLVKTENHLHQVGFSERTQVAIEPRLSTQWFLKMEELASPALKGVLEGMIAFYPPKLVNSYRVWVQNLKDWCISRQLWWGHPIPAYYLSDGRCIVAENPTEALAAARLLTKDPDLPATALQQDSDVLDTWFSSWLWPITVFNGLLTPNNPLMERYYPTTTLVTGTDILFFWVVRMIIAGYTFTDQPPFKQVYFTGIVRDKQRKKMSKSLGNSPEPLELISKYGADSVRAGILFAAPAGNDLLFDESTCQQGAQFAHKLWHALRLLKSWATTAAPPLPLQAIAIKWLEARYQAVVGEVNNQFKRFQLSQALLLLYNFVWEDFCSHYLEMIKPKQGTKMAVAVVEATCQFFEKLLVLLHPFIPFITEEMMAHLKKEAPHQPLICAKWPQVKEKGDQKILVAAQRAFELIRQVRYFKNQQKINQLLTLYLVGSLPSWLTLFMPYIQRAAGLTAISPATAELLAAPTHRLVVGAWEFALPVCVTEFSVAHKEALKKELAAKKRFLLTIQAKLTNKAFLEKAPGSLIEKEKKKEKDTLHHIEVLQKQL